MNYIFIITFVSIRFPSALSYKLPQDGEYVAMGLEIFITFIKAKGCDK